MHVYVLNRYQHHELPDRRTGDLVSIVSSFALGSVSDLFQDYNLIALAFYVGENSFLYNVPGSLTAML